jgi:uncharacterized protein
VSEAVAVPAGVEAQRKAERLRARLTDLGSAVVAYSGGIDSAFLAVAAADALGPRALAVTAESPSYPARHRALALEVARAFALRHRFIQTAELARPEYRANAGDRCYHCKHELYTALAALARAEGYAAVLDGNNADDRGDYRPGRRAACELGVLSPLDEVGLTKAEIRALARERGLPTWDEPASACLASRIPYFDEVTEEKLRTIERAEEAVRALGFRVFRVRHHDRLARLEIARDEMPRALDLADRLVAALRAVGYEQVTLDLRGYRSGSLNEALRLRPAAGSSAR